MPLHSTRNAAVDVARPVAGRTETSSTFLLILLLVTLAALLLRWFYVGYFAGSLSGDDAYLFINQSHELGMRSLWTSYNGYHFLYQRVVSLLASRLPLEATPIIFLFAWLLAFFSVVLVLRSHGEARGLNKPQIVCLVCAIALQPNAGEPFFILNPTHFFLGMALVFYVCLTPKRKPTPAETVFLIVSSLTGPSSTLLIPILALQLIILRDFRLRKWVYVFVSIGGLIQAISIFSSKRISPASVEGSVMDWLQVGSALLFFGRADTLAYILGGLFWSITFIYFYKWIREHGYSKDRAKWASPFLGALTAALFFLAATLSASTFRPQLNPLGFGSTYFLTPYALSFYVALACTNRYRAAHVAVVCMISIICAAGLVHREKGEWTLTTRLQLHDNIEWAAYTKFQRIKPDLGIPINPPWPVYPPFWSARLKRDSPSVQPPDPIVLSAQQGESMERGAGSDSNMRGSSMMETELTVYFDIKNYCTSSTFLGLELDIWRSRMGWARVLWGRPGSFDLKRSLQRFYPNGSVMMQFAFQREMSDYTIRVDLAEGVPERTLEEPDFKIMKDYMSRAGHFVGQRTSPGGEVRIDEVRLFCLQ